MSAEAWFKAAELGLLVAQAVVLAFMFLLRSSFASKTDLRDAHARADAAHHRHDVLEERLRGYPTYEVTNALAEKTSHLEATHKELAAELRSVDRKVDRIDEGVMRIEQHLMGR
ncbi:MAG: DUF2730 family protein [Proteobacteria bacterium]|nr:DUF2730 family protein [Pseudomonadota bacterium]